MIIGNRFADEALVAVNRSASVIRGMTREEKIAFLIHAGILGEDRQLLPRFRLETETTRPRKQDRR